MKILIIVFCQPFIKKHELDSIKDFMDSGTVSQVKSKSINSIHIFFH